VTSAKSSIVGELDVVALEGRPEFVVIQGHGLSLGGERVRDAVLNRRNELLLLHHRERGARAGLLLLLLGIEGLLCKLVCGLVGDDALFR
jgi:hypothetical protein